MKTHYCLADKTTISYEGECNWCGEKEMKQEPVAWMSPDGKFSTTEGNLFHIPLYTAPRELSDEEILEAIEEFREWTNPPYKAYEDTYMDGWLDACNEIYSAVFEILKKASEK